MPKVKDIARYVKSKNAGPFWVTLEIFCETKQDYETLKQSASLAPDKVAEVYGASPDMMKVFYLDDLFVIKYSYQRNLPQGHKYENDMHSGQQYIRLAELDV